MKMMSREELEEVQEDNWRVSKAELCAGYYPNCTFDTAVPHGMPEYYGLEAYELAMGYAKDGDMVTRELTGILGVVLPLTTQARARIYSRASQNEADLLLAAWKAMGMEP